MSLQHNAISKPTFAKHEKIPLKVRKPSLSLLVIALALVTPVFAQNAFPEGPAKEYVERICLQCHQASMLLDQHRTEDDWKRTVARMAQKRGASASAEQFDAIAAYMAKNFPKTEDPSKLNMNQATAEDIVRILGLTPNEAKALVTYREKHGDYRQWGDMLVVYGVDGRKIEAAKEKMTF